MPAAWSPSQYGFLTSWVASRQAAPFGSVAHDSNIACTSIRLPPTCSLSFVQLAALGHNGSEGLTRLVVRAALAVAAFVESDRNPKPLVDSLKQLATADREAGRRSHCQLLNFHAEQLNLLRSSTPGRGSAFLRTLAQFKCLVAVGVISGYKSAARGRCNCSPIACNRRL